VPVNNSSIRLQILQAMKAAFVAVAPDQPTDDPMGWQFTTVAIGPLADADQRKRLSMGIHVGQDQLSYKFESQMHMMAVNLELRLTINRGDESPGEMLEQIITMVQRVVMANRKWGGLAIDTKIVNTDVDLLTYLDRSAMAAVALVVQFRHHFSDPRNPMAGGS
jgi:hypothetical protein